MRSIWLAAILAVLTAWPALAQGPTAQLQSLLDERQLIHAADGIDDAVDRKDWERARSFFADEVEVDFSSLEGGAKGVVKADDLVAGWQTNLFGEKKSLHMRTNHLVTIVGDRAVMTSHGSAWNQLTGLDPDVWEVWGFYTHEFIRTADGWKVTRFVFEKTYERGNPEVRTATATPEQQL
jgi:hypothetical protein